MMMMMHQNRINASWFLETKQVNCWTIAFFHNEVILKKFSLYENQNYLRLDRSQRIVATI